MAYTMYLDGVLMPITPSKVKVKINNQNDTLTLINGEEINILKEPGLTDVSFDLLLPQVSYPFTNGGAQSADYYLSLFERLKTSKQPFQFILNRSMPSGRRLFYTNLTVGMEDYQITDDAEEGFDLLTGLRGITDDQRFAVPIKPKLFIFRMRLVNFIINTSHGFAGG